NETLDHISLLIAANQTQLLAYLQNSMEVSVHENHLSFRYNEGYPVSVILTDEAHFDETLFSEASSDIVALTIKNYLAKGGMSKFIYKKLGKKKDIKY
ncbi:MAG: hypothetical protein ACK445_11685, partial [Bacteroidota bacterium]